jgi:hypothetical protein
MFEFGDGKSKKYPFGTLNGFGLNEIADKN